MHCAEMNRFPVIAVLAAPGSMAQHQALPTLLLRQLGETSRRAIIVSIRSQVSR